ncbi:M20 family metallopeptidase [Candidatus Bathyarchaeota archaeon]|nr:M20 family metallopeptidase [Candidatus Bathyarchaeota archaeon]
MKGLRTRIVKHIEDREEDLINLCCGLIQAEGENPPGDVSKVAEVTERFLEKEAISYEKFEPVEDHVSIVASVGKEKPTLILCGHLDVVPAGDSSRWAFHPYNAGVREGKILGRGATDMKGGVAAMLMVAAVLKDFENEFSGRLVVASVSDEEAPGPGGVSWLLKNRKLSGNACLIAEPTGYLGSDYSIVAGERGVCWLKITAHGKPSHGSRPMLGRNAILMLTDFLPMLSMLEESAVKIPNGAKPLVRAGKTALARVARKSQIPVKSLTRTLDHYTVNVGTLVGGTKINMVPERCEAEVDVRVPMGGNPNGVEEFVRGVLPENFECQIVDRAMPSYTPASEPLIKVLQGHGKEMFGYKPPATFIAATSDAHQFRQQLGIPTVSFGPGYEDLAHAYNEFVYAEDLVNMVKVYVGVVVDYLNLLGSSPVR